MAPYTVFILKLFSYSNIHNFYPLPFWACLVENCFCFSDGTLEMRPRQTLLYQRMAISSHELRWLLFPYFAQNSLWKHCCHERALLLWTSFGSRATLDFWLAGPHLAFSKTEKRQWITLKLPIKETLKASALESPWTQPSPCTLHICLLNPNFWALPVVWLVSQEPGMLIGSQSSED